MGLSWPLALLGATFAVYLLTVLVLVVVGRRENARAIAGFVPDCAVLFSRLVHDPCVPRRRAALVFGLVVYLSLPIDLIPDFIPVLGYLDDAVLVLLVLRRVTRGCGRRQLETHWPGPASSLDVVLRLAGASR